MDVGENICVGEPHTSSFAVMLSVLTHIENAKLLYHFFPLWTGKVTILWD